MKKLIYITTPIRGGKQKNAMERMQHLSTLVDEEQYVCKTPYDYVGVVEASNLGRMIQGLLECDALLLDYDWQYSNICRSENAVAQIYHIPVFKVKQDEDTLVPLSDGTEYTVTMTPKQLRVLSDACDNHSRVISGQLEIGVMEYVDDAIAKEYPNADITTRIDIRSQTRMKLNEAKALAWNCGVNTCHGIHYDERADILFDMHQVMRHFLWLQRTEPKPKFTNDAFEATQFGNEPLIRIQRNDKK